MKRATFDGRAWVLPKEEVINNFIFRQNDSNKIIGAVFNAQNSEDLVYQGFVKFDHFILVENKQIKKDL